MLAVSLFYGKKITMNWDDYNSPHFHVEYAGHKATILIQECIVDNDLLSGKQLKLVLAWCEIHMNIGKLDKRYFFPHVLQVLHIDNFEVYTYMNDGSVRSYNAKPLLKKNTIFEPLTDIHILKSKLAVINDTIAWGHGWEQRPLNILQIFLVFFIVSSCVMRYY
jgi:hypothetical protein